MAFLLEADSSGAAERIENEYNYRPRTRPTLGVTVSQQYRDFVQDSPAHGARGDIFDTIAGAIDRFIRTHDAQVVLFAHVTGPPDRLDDRLAARQLRERCQRADRVIVVDRELDPKLIKSLISRCDVFCGARMHSNIAATSSLVPTVALAYSVKSRGIMGRMGMDDWVIEINEASEEELLARLDRLIASADQVRQALGRNIPRLREEAARNADIIRQLLERDVARKRTEIASPYRECES
jgi:colanic acid/amylovoran biosynthesis protein